jgi:hypothetical protein
MIETTISERAIIQKRQHKHFPVFLLNFFAYLSSPRAYSAFLSASSA